MTDHEALWREGMAADDRVGGVAAPEHPTLASILTGAEREAYRSALTRHAGSITETARELGVSRVTASRAVDRLGLRAWLDATYPHRDPATVGRRGDSRRKGLPATSAPPAPAPRPRPRRP